MSSTPRVQVGAIAERSVRRTLRQPASAIPPLIFPVALMLVNAGGFTAATKLPGLPDGLTTFRSPSLSSRERSSRP